jgi:hypothetical protein
MPTVMSQCLTVMIGRCFGRIDWQNRSMITVDYISEIDWQVFLLLTEWNNVEEYHNNQSQLHAVLRDPVPHLQRQTQRLSLLVKEMLKKGEVHGGVEV